MKYIALIAGLLAMSAAPLAAQGFRAENRVMVSGDASGFVVPNGGGFGARGIWCTAADFARNGLGARGVARLDVAEASQSGQSGPVRFTLDPTGLTPVPVTLTGSSFRRAGSNLSIDHAYSFCADVRLINR